MCASTFLIPLRPSIARQTTSPFICAACQRHESSYRRQRKALRVKLDPSFAPSKTETRDHIIFNPPSSAPNVYHTPAKFLPKSDPRRKLHSPASAPAASRTTPTATNPASARASAPRHLSPVRPQYEKKYHLGPDQIDEIRRLRAEDPRKWTRVRLAEKFECSQFFVSLCCSSPEAAAIQNKELEEIKKKWGKKKTEAREERQARKALWGRDA